MDVFRLPILDVRILGTIAATLITVSHIANPGPSTKVARPRVARGEPGVETLSFARPQKGPWIATTSTAGRVMLRSAEPDLHPERFLDFPGHATAVAFSPDGRSVAAAGLTTGIFVWNVMSAKSEPDLVMKVPIRRARHMMFSPDGRSLAITTDLDGTILIWDTTSRRERMVLKHSSPVRSLAFTPDGQSLAAAGIRNDWSIVLWDLQTGNCRSLPGSARGPIASLAFSPDGRVLASTSFAEQFVRLWDAKTSHASRLFARQGCAVNSVAFSPDGALVATAGNDGILGLWELATGRNLGSLHSHATCVRTVVFSPDGRTIVLATEDDDDIRLWDVAQLL